jgi:hypothetical protein
VSRYRIRYQGTDLEMPPGEFVVGRSSSCNLALDDALVSRRHATIHVGPEGAFVEDLGSRNGVLVNGERIEGRRRVVHLDRITIGGHELVLVEIPDRPATSACESCGSAVPHDAPLCPRCGALVLRGGATLVGRTLEIPFVPPRPDAGKTAKVETARPGPHEDSTAAALLGGIAEKAFALGRFDEAERVLGRSLQDLLVRAKAGTLSAARLSEGTRYALRLAEGTKRTTWLEWIFDAHAATGRLLAAEDIEKLYELVRKLRYTGGSVRRYLDVLRTRANELSPAEKFLLSRLEGIERMVSA